MTTTTRRLREPPQAVDAAGARGRVAGAGGRRRPAGARRQPADPPRQAADGGPQAAVGGRRPAAPMQAGQRASRYAPAQMPEQSGRSGQASQAPAPPRPRRPLPRRPPGPAVPGSGGGPARSRPRGAPHGSPGTRPAAAPRGTGGGVRGPRRPPFVFLVVGLLSGGLVCLLLLNTVLAAGTFQMTSLQQANAALARQQQELKQQIAYAQSPSAIAAQAKELGMAPVSQPRYLNLKSGHIYGQYGQAPGLVSRTGN